jgi:hypothetical protein
MICPRCTSPRTSFNGELAIHFPGIEGLHKAIVWVFPQLRICLTCGSGEFLVPEKEREVLLTGKKVWGAGVSEG